MAAISSASRMHGFSFKEKSDAMKPIFLLTIVLVLALGTPGTAAAADPLPSWQDGKPKRSIVEFVKRATTKGGPEFVPPAQRIAVFDNDGTLWAEQPMYFQLAFVLDRLKSLAPQHPEWKEQEPFRSALAGDLAGVAAGGEKGLLELVAATHAGTTSDEFEKAVKDWLATAKHPRFNRPYTDLVYQPMLELLAFLRASGFKTSASRPSSFRAAASSSCAPLPRESTAFRRSRSSAAASGPSMRCATENR